MDETSKEMIGGISFLIFGFQDHHARAEEGNQIISCPLPGSLSFGSRLDNIPGSGQGVFWMDGNGNGNGNVNVLDE